MLRTLFYTLLGALMAAAWAQQPATAAGLATALALVMVARTCQPNPRQRPPAMSSPIKTKRKKAIWALLPAYCAKCGATDNLTIDHIVPRVRGGTNELANLQTLCAPCNQRKSRKE